MYKSYTEEFFNKLIDNINQQDLEHYFQQEREETLFLEFKSCADKPEDKRSKSAREAERIKGVLKTIDAFLNSSGGLLIWGAPEPEEVLRGNRKVKMCKGALLPVPDFYDRDDFINKLASQISPIPQGVRMQPVAVNSGFVYLFEVPESQNKPHQYDGRYYVRLDTRTDIAPHYLVYALCRQIKIPNLKAVIDFHQQNVTTTLGQDVKIASTVSFENTTPFVNDFDVYLIASSSNCYFERFGNKSNEFHETDVAKILSPGIYVSANLTIVIPQEAILTKVYFDIWYGGRKSNVKQARYSIKLIDITVQGAHVRTYKIEAALENQSTDIDLFNLKS